MVIPVLKKSLSIVVFQFYIKTLSHHVYKFLMQEFFYICIASDFLAIK
ncbi:hypothetical protein LLB_3649 [Legionella longbeachae D-4968]|nr:hypothetical protein LLB_3649 [Legionella longbeachae D-4968]